MTLSEDLQEISGVGPATAEEIIAVVEEHDTGVDRSDIAKARDLLGRGRTNVAASVLDDALKE